MSLQHDAIMKFFVCFALLFIYANSCKRKVTIITPTPTPRSIPIPTFKKIWDGYPQKTSINFYHNLMRRQDLLKELNAMEKSLNIVEEIIPTNQKGKRKRNNVKKG